MHKTAEVGILHPFSSLFQWPISHVTVCAESGKLNRTGGCWPSELTTGVQGFYMIFRFLSPTGARSGSLSGNRPD